MLMLLLLMMMLLLLLLLLLLLMMLLLLLLMLLLLLLLMMLLLLMLLLLLLLMLLLLLLLLLLLTGCHGDLCEMRQSCQLELLSAGQRNNGRQSLRLIQHQKLRPGEKRKRLNGRRLRLDRHA
jgi:hypothetical protein